MIVMDLEPLIVVVLGPRVQWFKCINLIAKLTLAAFLSYYRREKDNSILFKVNDPHKDKSDQVTKSTIVLFSVVPSSSSCPSNSV